MYQSKTKSSHFSGLHFKGQFCKNSLMNPRSTEGSGKALVLLQVGQSIVVKLHGLAGKPATKFVDALLHPADGISVKAAEAELCSDS